MWPDLLSLLRAGEARPNIDHMKILVCITKTADTTAKISFTENSTKFAEAGVQWIINPYDEWYALVRAIEIKEKLPATVIHLISVGGSDYDPILRKALALGGDEAIRIQAQPEDSFAVAKEIAAVAKEGGYDLILTGRETIDYNGAAVGAMLAELLDMPYIGMATRLELSGAEAVVHREVEGGEEVLESTLPLVLGCQKGMAEQRIPNMKGIMGARSKPLRVVEPAGVAAATAVRRFDTPPPKAGVRLVPADNPAELIRLLREEAKVI